MNMVAGLDFPVGHDVNMVAGYVMWIGSPYGGMASMIQMTLVGYPVLNASDCNLLSVSCWRFLLFSVLDPTSSV